MNKEILKSLKTMKSEVTNVLDLSIGHDDPNHILNKVICQCNHPLYYCCGFYKMPFYCKDEKELVPTSEFSCDYCLLRCLECGDFIAIYKPKHSKENWYTNYNGKKIKIIKRPLSYDVCREDYLAYCMDSKQDESTTSTSFTKKFICHKQEKLKD